MKYSRSRPRSRMCCRCHAAQGDRTAATADECAAAGRHAVSHDEQSFAGERDASREVRRRAAGDRDCGRATAKAPPASCCVATPVRVMAAPPSCPVGSRPETGAVGPCPSEQFCGSRLQGLPRGGTAEGPGSPAPSSESSHPNRCTRSELLPGVRLRARQRAPLQRIPIRLRCRLAVAPPPRELTRAAGWSGLVSRRRPRRCRSRAPLFRREQPRSSAVPPAVLASWPTGAAG